MTIRNITKFTNVALAVAALTLVAPMAQSQSRMYNNTLGVYNNNGYNLLNAYYSGNTLGMYNNGGYNLLNAYNNGNLGMYNNGAYNLLNAYNNNSFYGYVPYNAYGDNGYGVSPYRYNNPGGALVLGSDGQLYNPFLNNGGPEPTVDADGITIPAPVVPIPVPSVQSSPILMSDQIDAVRLSGNRVRIEWTGDPRPVAAMTFSLLDKNRTALKLTIINGLPAQAVFAVPSKAAYYRVVITYSDGAMRSIVSPL
jgi:hypothetical protein